MFKNPFALVIQALVLPVAVSAMSVDLSPSIPSPAPVATLVTFTATVYGADPGTLWYRFRSHRYYQDSHLIKDYGPESTLVWTASDHEGYYEIDVDVRNISTGDTANGLSYFAFRSLITGRQPVITTTSHPMVFLYSAPACREGGRMKVQFASPEGLVQSTPYKDCARGLSMNFYLAGMRGDARYSVMHVVDTGLAFNNGPVLTLGTPPARTDLTPQTVIQASPASSADGIVLQSTLIVNPQATDLSGNLIWYYPNKDLTVITRPAPGGYFFGVLEVLTGDQSQQILREVDLVGMTVLQTNAARVNEQLTASGKRPISGFHHEARLLADGKIAVLGGVEQILTDVQGPGPVDVLGDMILILDSDLQVVWAWDTFDHLDVTRQATLLDKCGAGGCPSIFLATAGIANDWTHGNCVQQTPDGNLLYSSRSQDMVFKIDYSNGAGSGNILWRLGKGGDFQLNSTDPSPWFSHQHDAQFQENNTITLFDNGNVRNLADPSQNSRGQVLEINEQNMTVNLTLNVDLGNFSVALGSAQRLSNNNFHFDIGYLSDGAYSTEISPGGDTVYSLHSAAPEYRSFRMSDLYSPPYGTH
jgi:arylsulfate sulfotransferase